MTPVKAKQPVCANCKKPKGYHVAVNFADGNLISGVVLLCPKAVWREVPRRKVGT